MLLLISLGLCLCVGCNRKETNTGSSAPEPANKNSARRSGEDFFANLPEGMSVPERADEVSMRLLADYGAMFVARGDAVPPPTIIFADEAATNRWQSSVKTVRVNIGGINIELQAPAMAALMEARSEARKSGLMITPRGTDAARRSFAQTIELWRSRVNPGLSRWVRAGRLSRDEAARIRALSPAAQVPEILRLEKRGLYFSKDFSKSILYSVAAPGASQHLSMLAFDVSENENADVRSTLARHGWFQTVLSDKPHFTFLGVTEDELPSLGLKKVTNEGRAFWIPKLD